MGKMSSYSKRRITYNKVRLSLFLHSYGAYIISRLFEPKNKSYPKLKSQSIRRVSQILNLNVSLLKSYFISGKYPRKIPKPKNIAKYIIERKRIFVYLEVEKEILNLMQEKQDWQDTALEDYERVLFEPALERTAGNHLCNIKDDLKFDQELNLLKVKYRTYYYYVADKYKLPTMRNLPFILRLIT